jgi:hypothetical protein
MSLSRASARVASLGARCLSRLSMVIPFDVGVCLLCVLSKAGELSLTCNSASAARAVGPGA